MGRWEPGAGVRLAQAAMELYGERGFDNTTVAEIAERAGLTERTFFRHFADKREVLFGGADALQELLVKQVVDAPDALTPIEVILRALVVSAEEIFEQRREFARQRRLIISASVELQEREQVKLASLALALAGALRRRGVADLPASLAAEAGIAIFKVAFERWTGDKGETSFPETIRECADELMAVTSVQPRHFITEGGLSFRACALASRRERSSRSLAFGHTRPKANSRLASWTAG